MFVVYIGKFLFQFHFYSNITRYLHTLLLTMFIITKAVLLTVYAANYCHNSKSFSKLIILYTEKKHRGS